MEADKYAKFWRGCSLYDLTTLLYTQTVESQSVDALMVIASHRLCHNNHAVRIAIPIFE